MITSALGQPAERLKPGKSGGEELDTPPAKLLGTRGSLRFHC